MTDAKHTEAGEVCDGCGKLLICRVLAELGH